MPYSDAMAQECNIAAVMNNGGFEVMPSSAVFEASAEKITARQYEFTGSLSTAFDVETALQQYLSSYIQ